MTAYVTYVFELRASVAGRRGVPERISTKPYVYVGCTSKPADVRLEEHEVGRYVADRKWAKHYARARPDLADHNTYGRESEALAAESALAADLRRRGFTVVNKTGQPLSIGRRDVAP